VGSTVSMGSKVFSTVGELTITGPSIIPAGLASSMGDRCVLRTAGATVGLLPADCSFEPEALFLMAFSLFHLYSLKLSFFVVFTGLERALRPFATGNKVPGKLVPNGDCAIEAAAEDGVTDGEEFPDMFGMLKVGAGGI